MNPTLSFSDRIKRVTARPLFKRLTVYGFSASASQALMMIYAIVVARYLGPENYGLFAGNYALAGLTIFLVNWGMDTWMLREGGVHPRPRVLSGMVLQTKLIMGVLWAAMLVITVPLIRPALFPRELMLIVALDQLGDACLVTFVSGLNIERRTTPASWLLFSTRAGRLASAIILILLGARLPLVFALLRCSATLLGVGLGFLLLRPVWHAKGVQQAASTLRASMAYGIPELLALVYAQADVTLMGFLSTKTAVGEYAPAVSLVNALTIIPTSVFYILVPLLSKTYQTERERFAGAARQMAAIYVGVGLALGAGTAFVVSPLLAFLLGSKYQITGQLVLILSPIPLLKCLSYVCVTYLVVVGWQAKRIGAQIISAVLNVGLNLIFIPRYGPFGAAWIYTLSEAALFAGYLAVTIYHLKFYRRANEP